MLCLLYNIYLRNYYNNRILILFAVLEPVGTPINVAVYREGSGVKFTWQNAISQAAVLGNISSVYMQVICSMIDMLSTSLVVSY